MKRKISRGEMKDTVLNLTDIGFTVGAIAYALNKTPVNVYAHLKSAGRMKNRSVVRHPVDEITPGAAAAIRKIYAGPAWLISGASQKGSETSGTFKGSEKKAA